MAQQDAPAPPLYRPDLERDACGVALLADIRGRASRGLVEAALEALARVAHRGASGSHPDAVDGAGILLDIPWGVIDPAGRVDPARSAVTAVFCHPSEAAEAHALVERVLARVGARVAVWREAPQDRNALGPGLRPEAPSLWHGLTVGDRYPLPADPATWVRVRTELAVRAREAGLASFSLVSLSARTLVYKALVAAERLGDFYQDLAQPACRSARAIVHQRFSTNTLARWDLAHPFQFLAHNGEINTIAGNRAWARARLAAAAVTGAAPWMPADAVRTDGSDSRSLDDMLGVLLAAGMPLALALTRLMPPAWEADAAVPDEVRALLEHQACLGEPWDGPAAVAFTDGEASGMALDRNGFRPARTLVTRDGWLCAGSEAGLLEVPAADVLECGRIGPGGLVMTDARGHVWHGPEVRASLAARHPYRRWLDRGVRAVADLVPVAQPEPPTLDEAQWHALARRVGCDREELDTIVRVLAAEGHEAIGSMGDDTPLAALSSRPRLVTDYLRQRFAQVTNPPMDPIRERCVMALSTWIGWRSPRWLDAPRAFRLVRLDSPLLHDHELAALARNPELGPARIALQFDASAGGAGLRAAIAEIVRAAVEHVRHGSALLVLSDRDLGEGRAAVPAVLAVGAVHAALSRAGLRLHASIIADAGEARDSHQCAALIAFGASAVCPWFAYRAAGRFAEDTPAAQSSARKRYRSGLEEGLLKILSKIGVATVASYTGSAAFESLGLDAETTALLPGVIAIGGRVGLDRIAGDAVRRLREAERDEGGVLGHAGFHGYRRDGDPHGFSPDVVRAVQRAARGDAEAYAQLQRLTTEKPPVAIRDLLAFTPAQAPISKDEVEPASAIARRFFASAMSVGALAPEAHRVLAIAMNRLGARSNSGEGGEEADRYGSRQGPFAANSATKQVASGRFGVTPQYLASASELQIKMAQGSKPGEGGQLPGAKVVDHIARLRHAQPGTTLISPPPHHDIYSIEDLAQLIFDLRQVNPRARMNVKLVAQVGVGIVAAGVAKAGAEAIQISGHAGGTGASPRSSIKHAGLPWEIGLAEAHQVLTWHGLREGIVLQTDGGLLTGRDVAVAAALGADEYGFGTTALVSVGCAMARQCHNNTCPVGIATQREDLRAKFTGTPEQAVAYLLMVAEDVRGILASLGLRTLGELVGRADLLTSRTATPDIDVAPLLVRAWPRHVAGHEHARPSSRLAIRPMLREAFGEATGELEGPARDAASGGHGVAAPVGVDDPPTTSVRTLRNTMRTVGTRSAVRTALRGRIGGAGGDVPPHVSRFVGTAGQSFGAFLAPGMALVLDGLANDGVGKGMHGGEVVIRHRALVTGADPTPVLVGNGALYGATGGALLVAGAAGERFAVRNSGATAVVEGVGDHGCEYMTGGLVVVIGGVGRNFGAGMTGGAVLFVGSAGDVERWAVMCHTGSVFADLAREDDLALARGWLEIHRARTSSVRAEQLLTGWSTGAVRVLRVAPGQRMDQARPLDRVSVR